MERRNLLVAGLLLILVACGGADDVVMFDDGDTTPSVATTARLYRTGNTKPTIITNFDDGHDEQDIVILFGDSETTIDSNENIKLMGELPLEGLPYDTITLRYKDKVWVEVKRTLK